MAESKKILPKISVRYSGLIELRYFKDFPDGDLYILECQKILSFNVQRIYFINRLANPKAVRGKHAHRQLEQVIFCINGSFMLHLDDGETKQSITLDDPSWGVRLGAMLWHTMGAFSPECVILVLASAPYDEADYIRDYQNFLRLAAGA